MGNDGTYTTQFKTDLAMQERPAKSNFRVHVHQLRSIFVCFKRRLFQSTSVSTDCSIGYFNRASELEVCVEKQFSREVTPQKSSLGPSRIAVFSPGIMGTERSASPAIYPIR